MKRYSDFFTRTFGPSIFWLPFDAIVTFMAVREHYWFIVVVGVILALLDLNALRKHFPHTRLGR